MGVRDNCLATMKADEIKRHALAIIDPQKNDRINKFAYACRSLINRRVQMHELQGAIDGLAEGFIEGEIALVAGTIEKVVVTTGARPTENDLRELFMVLCPARDELKQVVYRYLTGLNLSVQDYAMDWAYERLQKVAIAELALRASPEPKPLRSAKITENYIAPDTNVLIHFWCITDVTPQQLG
jgi:hypothetical protein